MPGVSGSQTPELADFTDSDKVIKSNVNFPWPCWLIQVHSGRSWSPCQPWSSDWSPCQQWSSSVNSSNHPQENWDLSSQPSMECNRNYIPGSTFSPHIPDRKPQSESDGLDHVTKLTSTAAVCYSFSYFVLFTYVFSLFLKVSHGTAALTHFSLTHIAATLLTHSTALVLTHSIAILIALPHWCSIYSGQSCRLFFS